MVNKGLIAGLIKGNQWLISSLPGWLKFQGRLKAPNPMSAFMRYQRYQDGDGRRWGMQMDVTWMFLLIKDEDLSGKTRGMGAK